MDLLTVLAHELGHVIGREHSDDHTVMNSELSPGERLVVSGEGLEVRGEGLEVRDQGLGDSDQDFSSPPLSALSPPLFSSPRPSTLDPRPDSAFRIPTSDFEVDALFARLDDDAPRAGDMFDEDDRDEQPDNEGEDGLDLWSVLYGLD
jgi:hypothetical protein